MLECRSNCLLEALRAKIKDPKNVKIRLGWEPWTKRKFWAFHAWWEINGVEHDFKPTVAITWLNYWWHSGKIRVYSDGSQGAEHDSST